MLKIRLRRMGAKHAAFYRVVVSDSRATPRSRFVETVGYYDPGTDPVGLKLDVARIDEWIKKGAHPSATVKSLLEKARPAEA